MSSSVDIAVGAPPPASGDEPVRRSLLGPGLITVVVGVALALRLAVIALSPAGIRGTFGYDPGVYYASADALIHGRLPYRDFTLLHPPGLMLALTPFAELGRLTTDHLGFMIGCLAFAVLGSLNAGLVTVVARRLGFDWCSAVLGGLFYALWLGLIPNEVETRLEPLGNATFLLALALLAGERSRRSRLAGGAFLGLTLCVKIWWIVPVLVVVFAQFAWRGRRAGSKVVAAAGCSAAIVCGPFFAAAPSAMWHMVITDQLGRGSTTRPLLRAAELVGAQTLWPDLGRTGEAVAALAALLFLLVLMSRSMRVRSGRFVVALAVTQLAVLVWSPTYFGYYAAFAGVGLALLVAAGAEPVRGQRTAILGAVPSALTVVITAMMTTVAIAAGLVHVSAKFPSTLRMSAKRVRCVVADSPSALIELDVLSTGLQNGCPNWVDVSGRTYGVDKGSSAGTPRTANQTWQRDIRRYLLSGDAMITVRRDTGLSPATMRWLHEHTLPYVTAGHFALRLTPAGAASLHRGR